jgi:hypothetical protein
MEQDRQFNAVVLCCDRCTLATKKMADEKARAFEDDRVSFRWKDYAHGNKQKVMTRFRR